jgi:DNA invertase Pin-like site-specific DNA recombinase
MNAGPSIADLERALRLRDFDPEYTDAPVMDLYARISQNRETGETEKTDRQTFDGLQSLMRRRCRLGEILCDNNLSAWKSDGKRAGWLRLVQRLASGESQGVQVWHTDRLMRNPWDLETLIRHADGGFVIASCFGEYDLLNPDHRFTLRILTGAACRESDGTSRRMQRKMAEVRDRGGWHGGRRPFGMSGVEGGQYATPEQIEAERAAIRWAATQLVAGGRLADIAREWERRGLRMRTGRPHRGEHVRQILSSPHVAGLAAHKGQVIGRLADVAPVLDESTWCRVGSVLAGRSTGRPRGSMSYPLSGVMTCGVCGAPMSGRSDARKDREPRRKYACCPPSANGGHVTVMAEPVEATIRDAVLRALADPARADVAAALSFRMSAARQALDAATANLTSLASHVASKTLSLAEWDIVRPPLAQAVEQAQATLDAYELADGGMAVTHAESLAELAERWDGDSEGLTRRAMTRQAFASIIVRRAVSKREQPKARLTFTLREGGPSRD